MGAGTSQPGHRLESSGLIRCGYDSFGERFATDHRPLYFDFDTDVLFGNATQVLASPAQRLLKSNNVEQLTQYIQTKYEYLKSRNAFQRAEQLLLPGNRDAFAERLDRDMLQASLDAERRTKRFGDPAWSIALATARRKASILRKCLTMLRTRRDMTSVIQRELHKHQIEMLLPQTRDDCVRMLRTERAEIKRIVRESYQRRDQERAEK